MLELDEVAMTQAAFAGGPVKRLVLAEVMRQACDLFQVTPGGVRGPYRAGRILMARHWFMYHAHKAGLWSLTQIANYAGRSDHTTVMHAVKVWPKKEARAKEMLEVMQSAC
jgi:chromosomal replication initiation ATPase DnaA